jgi:UV DNA damage endonuclease
MWDQRLGFACSVIGRPGLRASDGRRPENSPHLRQSIENLFGVLDYLREVDIRVFRLPSNFIPYGTHPDHPRLHWRQQIREAEAEIGLLRERLREQPVRLSFHPGQYTVLNSPRPEVVKSSLEELRWSARILDLLRQPPEARVLVHVGGVYNDRPAARARMERQLERLPDYIRRRLALENDDRLWNARETAELCQGAGIVQIFDLHHHACHSGGEAWLPALRRALETWDGLRPKIHLSSPRLQEPLRIRAHADYIDPWTWSRFCSAVEAMSLPEFDVMLEAKAKDLALLELRRWSSEEPQVLP